MLHWIRNNLWYDITLIYQRDLSKKVVAIFFSTNNDNIMILILCLWSNAKLALEV